MQDFWNSVRAWGPGKVDLRGELPDIDGRYGRYGARRVELIDTIVVHHTASSRDTTWRSVYDLHTRTNGWGGTGYHLGIRRGQIAYLGDLGTQRACVASENHHIICICLTGNYQEYDVEDRDALALASLVEDLQGWSQGRLGRKLKVVGHGDLGQTACPGAGIRKLLPGLASGDLTAPPAMPADEPSKDDIALAVSVSTIEVNRGAALFKAIKDGGYIPTGNEVTRSGWHLQAAAHASRSGRAVFYCRAGDWGNVRKKLLP